MQSPNQQPDPEAYLDLTFGDGTEFRMDRFNSTLFTFVGKTAISGAEIDNQNFNHIFFQTEETENGAKGSYLFNTNPVFNQLAGYMTRNEFPAVINQNEVPECDLQAWERCQTQDIGDFIPDDWA